MTTAQRVAQYASVLQVIQQNGALIATIEFVNGKAGKPLVAGPTKATVHASLLRQLAGATSVEEYLSKNPDVTRLKFEAPAELRTALQQTAQIEEEIVLFEKARIISFLGQPSITLEAWEVLELTVPALSLTDGRLITVTTALAEKTFSGTDIHALKQELTDWPLEVAFALAVQAWQVQEFQAPLFADQLEDSLLIGKQKYLYGSQIGEQFAYRAPVVAILLVPGVTGQKPAPALALIGRWFRHENEAQKCLAATKLEVARLLDLRQQGDSGLQRMIQAGEKTDELYLALLMLSCPGSQPITDQERFHLEELISLCPTGSIDLALTTYWRESAQAFLQSIKQKAPREPWDDKEGASVCEQVARSFADLLTVDPEDEPEFERACADLHAVLDHLRHKDLAQARAQLASARRSIVMMYESPTPAEVFAARLARAMGVND